MTWIGARELGEVERMLVRLCRRDAEAALGEADLRLLAREDFRGELRALAAAHRVAALVMLALARDPLWPRLSAEAAQALLGPVERLRSFEALLLRAQGKDRELERLLGLLRGEGLEPLVLKGPALRRTAYARAVERPYSDFDLLFRPEQVDPAIGLVSAAGYAFPFSPEKLAGYRALHFHVLLRQQRHFRAEIHWGLSKATSPFQLDADAFERRAVSVQGADGAALRVPCPEHLLLHMAHENLRDSFSRFGRIVDLDRIVASAPALDWDYAVSQARAGGLESLLFLSLALGRGLLGTRVPEEALASLRPRAATRFHVGLMRPAPSLVRRRLHAVGATGALQFWLSAGWRRRSRLLLRMLSGRQSAEGWIFRVADAAPPAPREALLAGLKSGAKLVGRHAALYWGGLRNLAALARSRG